MSAHAEKIQVYVAQIKPQEMASFRLPIDKVTISNKKVPSVIANPNTGVREKLTHNQARAVLSLHNAYLHEDTQKKKNIFVRNWVQIVVLGAIVSLVVLFSRPISEQLALIFAAL